MTGKAKRIREITKKAMVGLIFALFVVPVLFLFISNDANAIGLQGWIFAPISLNHYFKTSTTTFGGSNLDKPDQVYSNSNPTYSNDNEWMQVIGTNFYWAGALTGVTYGGQYFDYYSSLPSIGNATLVECVVWVTNKAVLHEGDSRPSMNHGWFSVGWADASEPFDAYSWNPTGTYSASKNKNNTAPYLYNSTEFDYLPSWTYGGTGVFVTALGYGRSWDVTDYVDSYANVTSSNFAVVWNFNRNTSQYNFDYIGMRYTFQYTGYGEWNFNIFELTLKSIIWIIIVFLPAMLLAQVIPTIGFLGGIAMMLLILGFTVTGFASVMVVGLIALGIVSYKGD